MTDAAPLLSSLLGWIYTTSWSLSFYPQVILNYQRKSITGVSFDFLYLNVFGFLCYSIFNIVSLTSTIVKEQYSERNDGHEMNVRWNDAVFAVHATLISSITVYQSFIYKKDLNQKVSFYAKLVFIAAICSITIGILLATSTRSSFEFLDLIYLLSYIKLYITLTKYIPQAYLNYTRKSVVGWSIENILLDLTGGTLSFAQLFLDSYITNDWSILSNPGKLGLSLISISFDVLFIVQHFILYRNLEPLNLIESGTEEEEENDDEEDEGVNERSSLLR